MIMSRKKGLEIQIIQVIKRLVASVMKLSNYKQLSRYINRPMWMMMVLILVKKVLRGK